MFGRILVIGLLASALVFAQRGGGGGGGRGGGGDMGGGGMSFGGGNKLDRLAENLKLTKDQKKDIKQAMDEAQKESTPIKDQLTKSRLALAEAVAANKPKEEQDKASQAVGELVTQMTALELRTFAKMAAMLEDEQKKGNGLTSLFLLTNNAFQGKNWNEM